MKVKVIRIKKISSQSKFRGFADVILGDTVEIKGCGIYEGPNGLFAAFPSQKGKDEKYYPIVKIENRGAMDDFNRAVIEAYNQAAVATSEQSSQPSEEQVRAAREAGLVGGDQDVPF